MKTEWIEHKGKKILCAYFNGVKNQDEMCNILNEYYDIVNKQPGKVLSIVDFTDSSVGPDFLKEAKILGKKHADKQEKSAMLGITGLKGMLLKGYNLFTELENPAFSTKEEALEYLTS